MTSLSHAQFSTIVNEVNTPDGGFSIHAAGPAAGQRSKDSYMVGGMAPTGEYPHGATVEDAQGYVAQHRRTLEQPNVALGGWHHEGGSYFDASKEFPRTKVGEFQARSMSVRTDQIAFGELDHEGNYHQQHNNPFASQQQTGAMSATPESKAWAAEPLKTRKPGAPATPKRRGPGRPSA